MKNDISNLIQELTLDIKNPSETRDWSIYFWFSWGSCFSLMGILTYLAAVYFPAEIHLPVDLRNAAFWFETLLWFALAIGGAFIGFQSAKSISVSRTLMRLVALVVIALIGTTVLRLSPEALADDFSQELDWYRGPCGGFIFLNGALATLWMFAIFKRAAPTNLVKTGAWGAVSVGAFGSMFMHLVCTHENAAHAFVWHMAPLLLLVGISSRAAKFQLRW